MPTALLLWKEVTDVAQVEKYTLQQAKAIIAHVERTGATHSNESINPELTRLNYNLWPTADPDRLILDTNTPGQSSGRYAWRRLEKRLSEVSRLDRDDVNVLCDWCIHLGPDVPPSYESYEAFFKACVRYICRLYGAENVVFAAVHMDEETPHIHIGFVPVVKKELQLRSNASKKTKEEYEAAVAAGKTVIEKVDAHSVINRRHLQSWHGGFQKFMTAALGYDPAVYTGVTEALGGNMNVNQLKRQPKDWRRKRNKAADAFHTVRRAAKAGINPPLAARQEYAEAKRNPPQAKPGQTEERKQSLTDKMKDAQSRSGGRSGW